MNTNTAMVVTKCGSVPCAPREQGQKTTTIDWPRFMKQSDSNWLDRLAGLAPEQMKKYAAEYAAYCGYEGDPQNVVKSEPGPGAFTSRHSRAYPYYRASYEAAAKEAKAAGEYVPVFHRYPWLRTEPWGQVAGAFFTRLEAWEKEKLREHFGNLVLENQNADFEVEQERRWAFERLRKAAFDAMSLAEMWEAANAVANGHTTWVYQSTYKPSHSETVAHFNEFLMKALQEKHNDLKNQMKELKNLFIWAAVCNGGETSQVKRDNPFMEL